MKILSNIHDYIFSKLIIYTKLIQWLNMKFNIPFSDKIYNYLQKFTNKSPYINDDISHINFYELENKYGIEIEKIPINSGTISIVFKAKIKNEDIVLKIKRNGIDKKINNAINIILYIGKFIKKYIYSKIDIELLIMNIKEKFHDQTDFLIESKNINKFKEKINHRNIEAIQCYENLSDENMIVMNYVEGKTIYELNLEEKEKFGQIYLKTFMYLVFKKRMVHLDLHPGNLLFKDDKIIYLDLGLIYFINNINELDFLFNILNCFIYSKISYLIEGIELYKDTIYISYTEEKILNLKNRLQNIDLEKQKNNLKFLSQIMLDIMQFTEECDLKQEKNLTQVMLFFITNISLLYHIVDGDGDKLFDSLKKEIINFF